LYFETPKASGGSVSRIAFYLPCGGFSIPAGDFIACKEKSSLRSKFADAEGI